MRKYKQFGMRVVSLSLALAMTCSFTFGNLGSLQAQAAEVEESAEYADDMEDAEDAMDLQDDEMETSDMEEDASVSLQEDEEDEPSEEDEDSEDGEVEQNVNLDNIFDRISFLNLFKEEIFSCNDSKVSMEASNANQGVIFTGKNSKVKAATFTVDKTFDFGEKGANRVMIDAVAKRGTKTMIKVFVDDETEPVAEARVVAQKREDNWERYNEVNVLLTSELKGEHTLHFVIEDPDTADDKKTTFLFRSMRFVRDNIPVVNLDIDESFGSIDDMNNDKEHNTECYGDLSISVPTDYVCEFDFKGETYPGGTYKLDYIRGRGNSTWSADKKPYKIKFDEKVNLFNMGSNKHWVLLANSYDDSLIRNRMTYWLGRKLEMPYTPECVSVDVYMNKEYLGNYLLCEQVRVGEDRVDIFDLENAYEKKDMTEEDDLTGGYLLSMSPYGDEKGYAFMTEQGCSFYVESPESTYDSPVSDRLYNNDYDEDSEEMDDTEDDASNEEVVDDSRYALANAYITDYVQKLETAIFSPDFSYVDEEGTAHHYSDYMDVDSAVKYFWIQELSSNGDAYCSPSTYLYKDNKDNDNKLCWGPIWDFDYVAWGSTDYSDYDENDDSYGNWMRQNVWFERLMEDDEFVQKVVDYWNEELKPTMETVVAEGGLLDQYQAELIQSAYNNFDKYGMLGAGRDESDDYAVYNEDMAETQEATYESEIERLRSWITHKMAWVDANLDQLAPSPVTVKFMVDGKEYATVEGLTNRKINDFPEEPTKEYDVFGGWKIALPEDSELEDDEYFGTGSTILSYMIGENQTVTLNATWESEYGEGTIEGVQISQKEITCVFIDDEEEFNGFWIPYTIIGNGYSGSIKWSSSDESVAAVNEDGFVTAVGIGDAVITATTPEGNSTSVTVHMIGSIDEEDWEQYRLTNIELDATSLTMKQDEKKSLRVNTMPENVLYPSNVLYFDWFSLNEDIVSVEDGLLTAKNPGTTYVLVTCESDEERFVKYCEVTVEANEEKPGSDQPGKKPGDNSKNPGSGTTKPTDKKSNATSQTTEAVKDETVKAGTAFVSNNLKYVVTKASGSKLEVSVTGMKKSKAKLVIPDTITYNGKTFKVTSVTKNAFANNKKIKSVVIGKNVAKIGAKAFYKCKKCKSVTVKSLKLKKPGKQAFKQLNKKAKITLPAKKYKKWKKWFKGYTVVSAK